MESEQHREQRGHLRERNRLHAHGTRTRRCTLRCSTDGKRTEEWYLRTEIQRILHRWQFGSLSQPTLYTRQQSPGRRYHTIHYRETACLPDTAKLLCTKCVWYRQRWQTHHRCTYTQPSAQRRAFLYGQLAHHLQGEGQPGSENRGTEHQTENRRTGGKQSYLLPRIYHTYQRVSGRSRSRRGLSDQLRLSAQELSHPGQHSVKHPAL